MPYCTITHVRGLNPTRTYDATTKPTTTQVETMIDQIAAEIDTTLGGRGITVPVTDPTELVTYLQLVNAWGAAAEAESAMFPGSTAKRTYHYHELRARYEKAMAWLMNGNISGVDAAPFSYASENQTTWDADLPHIDQDKVF